MKIIIAGSRNTFPFGCEGLLHSLVAVSIDNICISHNEKVTEIVSGGARGADRYGEQWAASQKIPVKRFLPDYNQGNPRLAPLKRNVLMAQYADAAIVLWDGTSRGTKHMIECMKKLNKPVEVINI